MAISYQHLSAKATKRDDSFTKTGVPHLRTTTVTPSIATRRFRRPPSVEIKPQKTAHDWKLPSDFLSLGQGYDVFGDYAYSGSSMAKIFDWRYADAVRQDGYDIPSLITKTNISTTTIKTFSGETALDLQKDISHSVDAGVGFKSLFSSSVSVSFSSSELRRVRREYTIVQLLAARNRYIFNWRHPSARDLLSDQFLYALEHYSPEEIFTTYGTHFPTDIITGGRLDYSSSTNILAINSSQKLEVTAKASLSMMIGISAKTHNSTSSEVREFQSASDSKLITYGGTYESAAAMLLDGDPATRAKRYQSWLNTVPNNEVFIEFGARDSLRGIWELCKDQQRRQEIEKAARSFMERRDLESRINPDRIVDVAVIAGKNSNISAPTGYEKFPYDLNAGAGGDFIYLCFRRATSESIKYSKLRPVIDLKIILGDSGNIQAPTGFEKIPVDLNKGASGKFIYLCKKYGNSGDFENGVRDITIIGGSHSNLTPPYRYKKLPQDLNTGAKGNFIYLCFI